MFTRYLERKMDMKLESTEEKFCLEYYLLETPEEAFNPNTNQCLYGVEIMKNTDDGCYESEMVRRFSPKKEETMYLLEHLAQNYVTPVEMMCVIDDMLGI